MLNELQWIDSSIRRWLEGTATRPVVVDVSLASLRGALNTIETHAPSLLAKYRSEFSNFDELYRIAGLIDSPSSNSRPDLARSGEASRDQVADRSENTKFDAFVFSGTLDGPEDLDLIRLSGLDLSEAEIEKLWLETSATDLVRQCDSVIEREMSELDEAPTQSEKYFEYECRSRQEFSKELAQLIASILKK